ncbi:MAG: hypothetical protein N2169_02870 [bacterium]|nr:hypothetical protein [bacterium]
MNFLVDGIFETKLWVSNISMILKIIVAILFIIGVFLIISAFRYKQDLEEFFFVPLFLGIIDFICVYVLLSKNLGYKILFNGKLFIISKFSKEVAKLSLKNCDIVYKRRFLYDVIEFYDKNHFVFSLPSYWFRKNDFLDIKETLFRARKYYKQMG